MLQNAPERMREVPPGTSLPRLFGHVFLFAPAVGADVFEPGQPMLDLHRLARAAALPDKVEPIDCAGLVKGLVAHSYYLDGRVDVDLRRRIDGVSAVDPARTRSRNAGAGVRWRPRRPAPRFLAAS